MTRPLIQHNTTVALVSHTNCDGQTLSPIPSPARGGEPDSRNPQHADDPADVSRALWLWFPPPF